MKRWHRWLFAFLAAFVALVVLDLVGSESSTTRVMATAAFTLAIYLVTYQWDKE